METSDDNISCRYTWRLYDDGDNTYIAQRRESVVIYFQPASEKPKQIIWVLNYWKPWHWWFWWQWLRILILPHNARTDVSIIAVQVEGRGWIRS
jgi:hypothetical protein